MVERKRTRGLTVRMLDSELKQLDDLAEHEGITVSEWVRNVIRREHLLTFAERPSAKKRPKRK